MQGTSENWGFILGFEKGINCLDLLVAAFSSCVFVSRGPWLPLRPTWYLNKFTWCRRGWRSRSKGRGPSQDEGVLVWCSSIWRRVLVDILGVFWPWYTFTKFYQCSYAYCLCMKRPYNIYNRCLFVKNLVIMCQKASPTDRSKRKSRQKIIAQPTSFHKRSFREGILPLWPYKHCRHLVEVEHLRYSKSNPGMMI